MASISSQSSAGSFRRWKAIRKRWLSILLITAFVLIIGLLVTLRMPKQYNTTAQIFVATSNNSDISQLAIGNSFTQARVQTYTDIVKTAQVTEPVIRDLRLSISPEALANQVTATAPPNKVLILITVQDTSPSRAAAIANAVADQLTTTVESLEKTQSEQASPVRLSVIQPADVPTTPISPDLPLNLLLAAAVGLLLGVLAAIVADLRDNTVKDGDQFTAASNAPLMAQVPFDRNASAAVIAMRADGHGGRSEAFRQLRTNMQFVDVDSPPRVIAVTSAMPGEGKTHTAINLAAALAEAGLRVCLIEADLRRPSIAKSLGLVGSVGFTSVLIGELDAAESLQNAGRNLAVLTSGPVPPNPSELLLSEQCRRTIEFMRDEVDRVILDTAPLLPVADGAEIAALADATILVARYGKSRRDDVARATTVLANVGVRPVGTVLSCTPKGNDSSDYYYYSSSASTKPVSAPLDPEPASDVVGGSDGAR